MKFKTGDIVVSDGFLCEYLYETKDRHIVNNMSGYKVGITTLIPLRLATDEDFKDYLSKNLDVAIFSEKDEFKNELRVIDCGDYLSFSNSYDYFRINIKMSYSLAKALCKHFDIKG